MGGGGKFPYPKWVFSPAGGWWHNPRRWRRNTIMVGLGLAVTGMLLTDFAGSNQKVYSPPSAQRFLDNEDPKKIYYSKYGKSM